MFELCLKDLRKNDRNYRKLDGKLQEYFRQKIQKHIFTHREVKIDSYFFKVDVIKLDNASDGRSFLNDIRALLERHYGDHAYSFQTNYFELEVVIEFGE